MYLSIVNSLTGIPKSIKKIAKHIYQWLQLFLIGALKSSEPTRIGLSIAPWLAQTLARNFHFNTLFSLFISTLLTCYPLHLYQYYHDRKLDQLLSPYMPVKPPKLIKQLSSININDVNNIVVNFIFSYTTISSINNMLLSLTSPIWIYPLLALNISLALLCTHTLQLHQFSKNEAIEKAHSKHVSTLPKPHQKTFPLIKASLISLISLLCLIITRDSILMPYFLTKNIVNTPFMSLTTLDGGLIILLGYYWMSLSNHPIATTLPTILVHSKLIRLIYNITSSIATTSYCPSLFRTLVCHMGLSTTYISFKDNIKTSLKAHELQMIATQVTPHKSESNCLDSTDPSLLTPCLQK